MARLPDDHLPLAYAQLWPWILFDVEKRLGTRSIAVATRLSGPLDTETLRRCFIELVRRHESLRTRIVVAEGILRQQVDAYGECNLKTLELSTLPPNDRETEARRLAEQLVHEPVDISTAPLFAARLLRLHEFEHILVLAIDHIISDYASLRILLRDLWAMYGHSLRKQPWLLPELPVQFADYALWQQENREIWDAKHGGYWRARLAGARGIRLFPEKANKPTPDIKIVMLPIRLGKPLSARVHELSRREQTTTPMIALTAYVALMMRWCDITDLVIVLISMGRFHREVKNTVGFFAAALFLRLALHDDDHFLELLKRVSHEYYAAYEHADCGRIAAQIPRPEFLSNPRFNWIPSEFDITSMEQADGTGMKDAIGIQQRRFEFAPRNDFDARGGGCELILSDTEDGIAGGLWYRADLFSSALVERFERNFRSVVETMVTDSKTRVAGISSEP